MPESSHSANWVLVTPIPVACCGWGDFRENHVGLCAYHISLKSLLTGTWGKQLLHSTCKTPMSWNPALEDAKEPWLKIRERERVGTFLAWFFFPWSFFTKVHLEAGTWVGSQSSYFFFVFFCKLFWFSLALFILFLFFPGKFSLPRYFIIHVLLFFFKMLDCLQTEMLKMKFHFKNSFLFFPATMMSL